MTASAAKSRLLSIVPADRAQRSIALAQAPASPPVRQRKFEAAAVNRLTASWMAGSASMDDDLRGSLDALRNRSRDLFKNDAYAVKFGRMVRNNVVGAQGFVLQCAAVEADGKPDSAANRAIEDAWYRQCRPGNFEVTGKLSGDDFMRTVATILPRDGEVLIRKVRGTRRGHFGYQLQLLDVARLDTSFNREQSGSLNAVIMGVEVDQYRAPVAYHLFKSVRPLHGARERERVPAAEIMHLFIPWDAEQTRGLPWMHAGMHLLRQLGGYREAAVIAARLGAAKMGIYTRKGEGLEPQNEGEDADGNFVTTAEPGHFEVAPDGYTLDTWDPTYPHEQFDAFCKAALRGISSAFGVAYPSLGNDLEGVNFSSIRSGTLEEREEWMVIQAWMIAVALVPIFEEWLAQALLSGQIRLPNGSALPAGKIDKFSAHTWQGRRWSWVDPLKDVEASVRAISNHLASPQQIAAQTGRDIVDVLDDIQRYHEMLRERGLPVPAGDVGKAVSAPAAQAAAEDSAAAEDE